MQLSATVYCTFTVCLLVVNVISMSRNWAFILCETNAPALSSSDCVVAVFSVSAGLLGVHVWGSAAGLRQERCSPQGLRQMVQSLEQMLTARAHSLSLARCKAQRHTAKPRFGPLWRSPDNDTSPDSSCTPQNTPTALPPASPGCCRVV